MGAGEFQGGLVAEVAVVDFGVVAEGGYDLEGPGIVEAKAGADLASLAGQDGEGRVQGGGRNRRSFHFPFGALRLLGVRPR